MVKVKAMLHSRDRDGLHKAPLVDVEILEELGSNDYIVMTPDGIRCHALYNPFTDYYFADDVYRIVPDTERAVVNSKQSVSDAEQPVTNEQKEHKEEHDT